MIDICIIGGGAAGMTAAIAAAEENPNAKILILEKKNQPGKKILASGNGKCNLSNVNCENCGQTLDFFAGLGLLTRTDGEGRIYPYTEEAAAVRDALVRRLAELGVKVETAAEVSGITRGEHFIVELRNKAVEAKKVLISCGGKAGPDFGSTGDGFRFAKSLGHTVTKLIPVLTAVEVKEDVKRLSGIRAKGSVSLCYKGRTLFSEKGEIQFTDTGISGICVFNLSRFLLLPAGKALEGGFDEYEIFIDFFPDISDLRTLLTERSGRGFTGEHLLRYLVRRPVAEMIYAECGGDIDHSCVMLKAFPLSPKGVKGWNFAQATKGGVPLDELCENSQASAKVPGLYFAGEVLDYDGPCGGYNLQNAWETGYRAGKEMAGDLR